MIFCWPPSNLQFQAASAGLGKIPQFPQLQASHNPPNIMGCGSGASKETPIYAMVGVVETPLKRIVTCKDAF